MHDVYTIDNITPFMDKNEIVAIASTLRLIKGVAKVLEWGSGHSTLYYPSYLPDGSQWYSYEHDPIWYSVISKKLLDLKSNSVTVTLVPPGKEFDNLTDGTYQTFRQYILSPISIASKFDYILVDGRARVECMAVGWELLSENGIMALHDAQRREYDEGIPKDCYWVRMVNPYMVNEGPISTLFMAKSAEFINQLYKTLQSVLPDTVELSSNAIKNSIIFVNSYYNNYVNYFYANNLQLVDKFYLVQLRSIQTELFGDSDFYSRNIRSHGWEADDIIVNIPGLQDKWAQENGFDGNNLSIAIEQVRRKSPTVVYFQDLSIASKDLIDAIRPSVKLIVGQIASPVPSQAYLEGIDLIISSFPHFVERFRKIGTTAYYQPLAFEPCVLQVVSQLQYGERPIACSFVGGISGLHAAGTKLLETLVTKTPIQLWGYGAGTLPADSQLLSRHNGEVWGTEMFTLLSSSKITVNRHIDVAENYANNMRLFEATGCGALLITDYKDNLNELFEIGKEVVAYRSSDECAALINYYLAYPEEAEKIAKAGQERTLRDHTYVQRMKKTSEVLDRHCRYIYEHVAVDVPIRISDGHQTISKEDVTEEMQLGWKNSEIPLKQRGLVQQQLTCMYHGNIPHPFKVLTDILKPIVVNGTSILEIGCASGYYYEIIPYLLCKEINYCGVDYSDAMIAMAKDYYPSAQCYVSDGANLPFSDTQFDVVISSGILLHVNNYTQHIMETARVAKQYIVVARMPVCKNRSTQYVKKFAYEIETVEIRFNEKDLHNLIDAEGFELITKSEYHSDVQNDEYEVTYLYKKKISVNQTVNKSKIKQEQTVLKKMGPVVLVSRAIAFTFPLSYAYLAGYLRTQGEDVVVLFKDTPADVLVQKIMELNPLLVGFGSLYPELKETKELIRQLDLAGRSFPIVIGGQMVSPTPEFAVKITGADFGIIGEGELVLHQLVKRLRERSDCSDLQGLVIRNGEQIFNNGYGDYIKDLSLLPPIPYDLFPVEQWLPIGQWYAANCPQPHWKLDDRVINVHGGRGCPFTCNFCYHHSKPRYRNIELMMEEAQEALKRFNGNMLYFSDDLVLADPHRARQLIDAIARLDRPVAYSVSTRFDVLARMNNSLLDDLKRSGCRNMGLGLESGSDRILKIIGKNCTAQQIEDGLERLRIAGIYPSTAIMVGQYTETYQEAVTSLELMQRTAKRDPFLNYAFTIVTPFPGSKLFNMIFDKGLLKDHQEFYDRYFASVGEWNQVVNLSAMTEQEVYDVYRKMSISYKEIKCDHIQMA